MSGKERMASRDEATNGTTGEFLARSILSYVVRYRSIVQDSVNSGERVRVTRVGTGGQVAKEEARNVSFRQSSGLQASKEERERDAKEIGTN